MGFKDYVNFRVLKLRDLELLKQNEELVPIIERISDIRKWTEGALDGEGLYQMQEFKTIVKLSERTIARYINKGVISPLRTGGSYLFTDFDILDILEAHVKRDKGGRPSKAKKEAERKALEELEAKIDKYNQRSKNLLNTN